MQERARRRHRGGRAHFRTLPGTAPRYGLQDLLVVIPTSHDRLSLVEAGRSWRSGMQVQYMLLYATAC